MPLLDMKSVSQQLADYLKSVAPAQVASGELQRMIWRNKNGSTAVPRSVVRRLEELVEDRTLTVEIKDRHAWYSWGDPPKIPKTTYYVRHPLTGERITTEELAML